MYSFEILEVNDPRWEEIIKTSYIYDFHHTAFYHKIDNQYRSILFLAQDEQDFLAMPLVLRPIEGTDLFDLTSVYGYCGPITNKADFCFSDSFLAFFKERFDTYCLNNNIVSAFSRLHSLIDQQSAFVNFGDIQHVNKTISIDLTLSPEEQRKQYRKSNKSEINQLRNKGFYVEEVRRTEDIDRFIEIYYETMDRVNATPYYYFTKEYFHEFLANTQFESKLLVAKYEGSIVAGAIFTATDKIMQYHLAGTTEEFIRLTPMKLVLDEARLLGNRLGLEYLHLGGGVGGSDDDSLFRFKSGFSKDFKQFSVWKYIVDPTTYDMLVEKNDVQDKESNFFPLYRS
ncbi:GNAT family N-acetyltransferase [Sphingobacterium sp. SGR-19]|uniref:GNAT family N-acetyltransferase n=1 Tax=Sphingobacterium sp. SGR-19 TaxID=2710886 RepID=UPI0013EBDC56|nr:GNAT family N-acetyltransferase [Sphingobacterium sp. SGR-19]NGM67212.1 peptidoglycan bridge formation glycyltransferase FemA/FemB family protein [Sphingobacterium sp. SGR-19]